MTEHAENEAASSATPREEPGESTREAMPDAGWYADPDNPGSTVLRYWDGSSWTDYRSAPEVPAGAATQAVTTPGQFRTTPVSEDERRNILAQQIQMSAVRGLRIESQDRYQAILVEGQPVNHVLHAILTLATCLLWGIVWAVLAVTGGEKRHLISIDEYGNVLHQQLGKV